MNWPWTKPKTEPQPIIVSEGAGISGVIDRYSPTWIYVENWARTELQTLREQNDLTKHDAVKTAILRGRIRQLKEVIALPETDTRRKSAAKMKNPPRGILAGTEEDDE